MNEITLLMDSLLGVLTRIYLPGLSSDGVRERRFWILLMLNDFQREKEIVLFRQVPGLISDSFGGMETHDFRKRPHRSR